MRSPRPKVTCWPIWWPPRTPTAPTLRRTPGPAKPPRSRPCRSTGRQRAPVEAATVSVGTLSSRTSRTRADPVAVTASGLFVATFLDALDTTQLAIDLDLETHKGALFTNTITPNFTTDTAYGVSPYNANEVSGTNWAAG